MEKEIRKWINKNLYGGIIHTKPDGWDIFSLKKPVFIMVIF